jgi:hypothetical protein
VGPTNCGSALERPAARQLAAQHFRAERPPAQRARFGIHAATVKVRAAAVEVLAATVKVPAATVKVRPDGLRPCSLRLCALRPGV